MVGPLGQRIKPVSSRMAARCLLAGGGAWIRRAWGEEGVSRMRVDLGLGVKKRVGFGWVGSPGELRRVIMGAARELLVGF